MEITKLTKESFSVIGKEGSTADGGGFIQKLWEDANSHFAEIESLVKKDGKGNPVGLWGAMSDLSRSFRPWEDNLSKGLYLAGAEVREDAEAPPGWTKWTVPASEFVCVKADGEEPVRAGLNYLRENGLELAGAINDFIGPEDGQLYMMFPIRRL